MASMMPLLFEALIPNDAKNHSRSSGSGSRRPPKKLHILARGTGSSCGRRSKQEDSVCCHDIMLPRPDDAPHTSSPQWALVAGVFDGHGGSEVARIASCELDKDIIEAMAELQRPPPASLHDAITPSEEFEAQSLIARALRRAFISLDHRLLHQRETLQPAHVQATVSKTMQTATAMVSSFSNDTADDRHSRVTCPFTSPPGSFSMSGSVPMPLFRCSSLDSHCQQMSADDDDDAIHDDCAYGNIHTYHGGHAGRRRRTSQKRSRLSSSESVGSPLSRDLFGCNDEVLCVPSLAAVAPPAATRSSDPPGPNAESFDAPDPPSVPFSAVGTTASIAIIQNEGITVANLGDSRTIIIRIPLLQIQGQAQSHRGSSPSDETAQEGFTMGTPTIEVETFDHRPDREDLRLAAFSTFPLCADFPQPIVSDGRLRGHLAVSRALGDFHLKTMTLQKPHDTSPNSSGLLSNVCDVYGYPSEGGNEPQPLALFTSCLSAPGPVAEESSSANSPALLLVLSASDGLWDVFSTADVVATVSQHPALIQLAYSIPRVAATVSQEERPCDLPFGFHDSELHGMTDPSFSTQSTHLVLSQQSLQSTHCVTRSAESLPPPAADDGARVDIHALRIATPAGDDGLHAGLPQFGSFVPPSVSGQRVGVRSIDLNTCSGLSKQMDGFSSPGAATPRDNPLQKIIDDLVHSSVHERGSNDNVSVVLVAVLEQV